MGQQMSPQVIRTQFQENVTRARNLVSLYDKKMLSAGQGRRPVNSADVLRAAVVLLHATLEDFMRIVLQDLLPIQQERVLDKVPLIGTGNRGRAEKFLLGKLVQFRGRMVDDILAKSVEIYLERSNYNSPDDLACAIESVGLDKTRVESLFGVLAEMMDRRHWIVHRADRNPKKGRGQHKCKSIGTAKVACWIASVESFASHILAQLERNSPE